MSLSHHVLRDWQQSSKLRRALSCEFSRFCKRSVDSSSFNGKVISSDWYSFFMVAMLFSAAVRWYLLLNSSSWDWLKIGSISVVVILIILWAVPIFSSPVFTLDSRFLSPYSWIFMNFCTLVSLTPASLAIIFLAPLRPFFVNSALRMASCIRCASGRLRRPSWWLIIHSMASLREGKLIGDTLKGMEWRWHIS